MPNEVCEIVGRFAPGKEPAGWDGRDPSAVLYDDGIAVMRPVVRGGISWEYHIGTSDPERARQILADEWGEAEVVESIPTA